MRAKNINNVTINNVFCAKMSAICDECEMANLCRAERSRIDVCSTCANRAEDECTLERISAITISMALPPKKGTLVTACSEYKNIQEDENK